MAMLNSVLLLSPMTVTAGSASSCRPAVTATSTSSPSTGTMTGPWRAILRTGSTVSVHLAVAARSGSQRYVPQKFLSESENDCSDTNHSNSFKQAEHPTRRLRFCDRRFRSSITTLASTATLTLVLRTTQRTCSRTADLPFHHWDFNMPLALMARAMDLTKITTLKAYWCIYNIFKYIVG